MNEVQAWYNRWAVVRKTFPGHRGRPGQVGGSLPRAGAIEVEVTEGVKYNKARLREDLASAEALMRSYNHSVEVKVSIVESTKGYLGTGHYAEGSIGVDVAGKDVKAPRLTLGEYQVGGGGVYDRFRHEYGHHIFDKLPFGKREEFNKLYSTLSQESGVWWHEVSALAERNNYEGFSEGFAAYTSPKYKPGKLPKPLADYMATIKPSLGS